VKILLDTHILLWWMADHRRLPRPARLAIEDPGNHIFVSIASLWETAIKFSLKRVIADPEALQEAAERDRFSLLAIESQALLGSGAAAASSQRPVRPAAGGAGAGRAHAPTHPRRAARALQRYRGGGVIQLPDR